MNYNALILLLLYTLENVHLYLHTFHTKILLNFKWILIVHGKNKKNFQVKTALLIIFLIFYPMLYFSFIRRFPVGQRGHYRAT